MVSTEIVMTHSKHGLLDRLRIRWLFSVHVALNFDLFNQYLSQRLGFPKNMTDLYLFQDSGRIWG